VADAKTSSPGRRAVVLVPLELKTADSAAFQAEPTAGQQQDEDMTRRVVSMVACQRLIGLAGS
jgi:hypothetical protein